MQQARIEVSGSVGDVLVRILTCAPEAISAVSLLRIGADVLKLGAYIAGAPMANGHQMSRVKILQ